MPLAETQILQRPIVFLKPALVLFGCTMQPNWSHIIVEVDQQFRDCEKASNALLCS